MNADCIIKNGRVIDPARNIDGVQSVCIKNGRIVAEKDCGSNADHVIDAKGCLVFPGLIDFHTHLFYRGSGFAIQPDLMIAHGTTSAVDAGTAGAANFEAFYQTAVIPSVVRIKSFLTVYSGGQLDPKLCEDFNPDLYNLSQIERVIDKHRDNILGLKIRISKGIVPDEKALEYLKAAVALAEELNGRLGTDLHVCVHTTNSQMPAGELAECLRPGDIFCHCYQGGQNNMILGSGEIDPGVLEARERGVIFDAANGRGNFGIKTARAAMARGFYPDVISSDLTSDKFNMPPYAKNLPVVLSKYLTLGMNLVDIIRAVTETPAKLMKLEGEIGTLAPAASADVSIFELKEQEIVHKDWKDGELAGHELLVPKMTICCGKIQYCSTDFWN